MNNSTNKSPSNDWLEPLLLKVEIATIENRAFGEIASELIVLLAKYQPDTPIPSEFWELYELLASAVDADETGKLVFTEAQMEVMYIIRNLMRLKGLLVQLPGADEIKAKLQTAAEDIKKWEPFLEQSFYPTILEKANEEMEMWFFLSLLTKAMMISLDHLDRLKLSEPNRIALLSIVRYFPEDLIDLFISNRHLAKRAHQIRHVDDW